MIDEGALENSNVDALAERLGIGSRHLRRLFWQHLGATPIAVAQAQRLLSAKKLIDETTLPLTTIAIASRYGSIRRFNAAFRSTYGRSPRELRRENKPVSNSGPCTLQLRFRPPYDYDALLHFLAKRAIAGVEYVHGDTYRRTFLLDGQPGWLEITPQARTRFSCAWSWLDRAASAGGVPGAAHVRSGCRSVWRSMPLFNATLCWRAW